MWETKFFKSKDAQLKFIRKNSGKYQIVEIYINNGYGLDVRKLRKVY